MEKAAPFQSRKYRCEVTISEKRHFLREYAVVTSLPCLFTRSNYQTHFSALHCSQPSLSSYFLVFFNFFSFNFFSLNPFALLNTRIELRKNWTPAQNGRLDMFTASLFTHVARERKSERIEREARGGWGMEFASKASKTSVLRFCPALSRFYLRDPRSKKNTRK